MSLLPLIYTRFLLLVSLSTPRSLVTPNPNNNKGLRGLRPSMMKSSSTPRTSNSYVAFTLNLRMLSLIGFSLSTPRSLVTPDPSNGKGSEPSTVKSSSTPETLNSYVAFTLNLRTLSLIGFTIDSSIFSDTQPQQRQGAQDHRRRSLHQCLEHRTTTSLLPLIYARFLFSVLLWTPRSLVTPDPSNDRGSDLTLVLIRAYLFGRHFLCLTLSHVKILELRVAEINTE